MSSAEAVLALGQRVMLRAAELRGARSRVDGVGGREVHWLSLEGRADAPTIVLVHGLGGSALGFSRVIFRLARHARRVVALDLPGSGFSPVAATGPLGFAELVACVESFSQACVPERAVYLGHSLGGALVARFTARHPERSLGTVLVSPAGGRVPRERLEQVVAGFKVTTQREARVLARRFFSRPPLLLPLVMGPALLPLMQRPSVQRVLEEALRDSALQDQELAGLPLPILLLWARNDRVLPYESLEHFRAHLPRAAQIEEVEGFGHSPQLDRPRQLSERVERFLEERVKGNRGA